MSFSKSSKNIILKKSILYATCEKNDQSLNYSSLDLDTEIGNLDGELFFDGAKNFSKSCRNFVLAIDQNKKYVLLVEARKRDGTFRKTFINLDDIIKNNNGVLKFNLRNSSSSFRNSFDDYFSTNDIDYSSDEASLI